MQLRGEAPGATRRGVLRGGAGLAAAAAAGPDWAQGAAAFAPAERIDLTTLRTVTDLAGPEGPSLLPNGDIVTVEYIKGEVVRVTPAGAKTVLATVGPAPVGTAVGPDGAIYVAKLDPAAMAKVMAPPRPKPGAPPRPRRDTPDPVQSPARLFRIDPATNRITDLFTRYEGKPLVGPDDLVVDRYGDLWLTDFGTHCVYWCRTDGSAIRRVVEDAPSLNGITLSPDGRQLYIMGRRNLLAYTIEGRGGLRQAGGRAEARRVMDWPAGLEDPDGMRMEASGNLVMGCGRDGLVVVSPGGRIVSQTQLPGLQPINMAFAGPDLRTLYVAAAGVDRAHGKLVSLRWPRPGAKLA